MAKLAIKSENQSQLMVLPPSYDELVPANHPVRVVNGIVDLIDMGDILKTYKGGGNSCFNPRTMLKVLIFAYLNNIHSSRRIERQLRENVLYMWLSGGTRPDFRTINMFRSKRLKGGIESVFVQVVELLHKHGFVTLDVQYIDGTKIESVANKYTFVWKKSVKGYDAKLKAKTHALLEQIEGRIDFDKVDAEPPCESADDFQSRVDMIKEELENRNASKKERKAVERIESKNIQKMREYEEKLSKMENRNSYSKTDQDATFMRMKEDAMKNGQLKPGYNVQISTENQFITHYAVYQRPTDTMTLIPYLELFEKRYGLRSGTVVADSGYGSEQNYEWMFNAGMTPYVKYNYFHKEQKAKYRNNPFLSANFYHNAAGNYYVCPMGQHMEFLRTERRKSDAGYISTVSIYKAGRCAGCPLRSSCHKSKNDRRIEVNHNLNRYKGMARELLNSEEGLYHRGKRPVEPEAVFGHIKECGNFRRFRLKGLTGAEIEFGLKAIAHNMRKLAKIGFHALFFDVFCVKGVVLVVNRKPYRYGEVKLVA